MLRNPPVHPDCSTYALPEDAPAYATTIGKTAKHAALGGTTVIVVPGSPEASQLYYRILVRDLDQMPPLGTEIVDEGGVATIGTWISGLNE